MKNSRRDFLSHSLKMLGLMGISSVVSENFLKGILTQAYAGGVLDQPEILQSLKYIHFTMPGAPPRWYFDLPLTPKGKTAQNFMAGGFGNHYQISGSTVQIVHDAWKDPSSGLYLPPVWNMGVNTKDFSKVLKYTGFIRGIDNEINSHQLSNARQVSPIIGGYSLSGANADERSNPIAAVNVNGSNAGLAFKSRHNLSMSNLSLTANPISTLLDPFKVKASSSVHDANTEQLISQVVDQIDLQSKNLRTSKTALREAHENAKSLITSGVQTLSERYPATLAKYAAIVQQAVHPTKGSLPGIFDKKIPGSATDKRYNFGSATAFASITDLRDGITAQTDIKNMAAQFAVTEILITSGLTSTVVSGFTSLSGYKFTSSSTSGTITHDQHLYGNVVQTLINTLFFRAMLGCLQEFITVLEANQMINNSLIHIASEFNRSPRTEGVGADHGVSGSNATLISGMIKGPFVIGNVLVDSKSTTYKGTWGVAAPYTLDNEKRPIKVNDIARTITAMLRTEDVVTNGFSLLNPNGGSQWSPKKSQADNV